MDDQDRGRELAELAKRVRKLGGAVWCGVHVGDGDAMRDRALRIADEIDALAAPAETVGPCHQCGYRGVIVACPDETGPTCARCSDEAAAAPQARPESDGREGSDEEVWSDERPPDEGVSEAGEALLAKLRVEPGRWLRHATNVGIFWPLTDAALEVARLSKLGLIETHHERTTNGLANVWLRITEETHDV